MRLILYTLYVGILTGALEIWMAKPYLLEKKKPGLFLFFLMWALHDIFLSFYNESGRYGLIAAEMIVMYSALGIILHSCFYDKLYKNLIYILAIDAWFQIVGVTVSLPFLGAVSHFDMNMVGDCLDYPTLSNAFILGGCYLLDACLVRKLWQIMCRHQGKGFWEMCVCIAVFDIITQVRVGWRSAAMVFPLVILLLIFIFYLQEQASTAQQQQFEYYQAVEEIWVKKENELSKIRHDLARHLNVIEEMNRDEKGKRLLERIDSRRNDTTGISILDCMLKEKASQCEEQGITCRMKLVPLRKLDITEYDLISLFGNLLDNGIEAAKQVMEGKLDLNIAQYKEYLKIELVNSKPGNAMPVKNGFRTTKKYEKGHGIGTRIIREVVEKNKGWIKYQDQGEQMKVEVVLELPSGDETGNVSSKTPNIL